MRRAGLGRRKKKRGKVGNSMRGGCARIGRVGWREGIRLAGLLELLTLDFSKS